MKFVLLTLFCLLRVPHNSSIDMLDCALGHVNDQLCPEDGGWSHWSTWGDCQGECGAVGRETRTRNCSNPRPERNGLDCDGDWLDVKPCSIAGCSFEQYEKLLAQDEVRSGQLANLRNYSSSHSALLTKCLSSSCELTDVAQALPSGQIKFWNSMVCVKKNTGCPVVGGWGDWSPWTRCNAQCGPGQQMRCRACCDPPPSVADMTCRGETCEFQPCSGVTCGRALSRGGDWSQWSSWSGCSTLCNFGYMRRTRVCQKESKMSSNEKLSAFNEMNDYENIEDYVNAAEYYNYAYYNNDNDTEESEDDYEDSKDGFDKTRIRAKRSKNCDKVEYYNNDEDDLLPSTPKTRKMVSKKGFKTVEKNTESTRGKYSLGFQNTEDETLVTKLKTGKAGMGSRITSLGLDSDTSDTLTFSNTIIESRSEAFTQNYITDELSDDIKIKAMSKMSSETTEAVPTKNVDNFHSKEMEDLSDSENSKSITKCKQKPNTSKKGNRVDPIVLDDQDSGEGKCGGLYQNPLTASSKNMGNNRISVSSMEVNKDGKNKCSISTVPYSTQTMKKSGITTSSLVNDKYSEPSLSTSPSTIPKSSSTETVVELFPMRASSSAVTTTKQSLSADGTDATTSGKSTIPNTSFTTSPLGGLPYENPTTLGTSQESQEIDKVSQQESNITGFRQVSCDISAKLQLPSFSDLFAAEGCSGPFEELKPCNTQPCNEDGGWSEWSSWSACAPDCGLGWQVSVRSCTNPEPRRSGSQCQGETSRRRSCYLQPCLASLKMTKAVFMTGESVVKYEATQQHASSLLLYVRLRHFSPTGSVISRRAHDCVGKRCDHVTLSLYRSHVLVSIRQRNCHTDFVTSQRLSVGEWHEVLLTVVGAAVTLRLDDSVLNQLYNLSCRPNSPNYDSDMIVGGNRFVGEVDRLRVNFKNYKFQKTRDKRDNLTLDDDGITPSESSQMQYEANSKDVISASLSHLLQVPCYLDPSNWNIELAIKPNLPDGLVLFIKGYDSHDFLFVSLEQTRIRLRVRVAAQAGECELAEAAAPLTWLHLRLSKLAGGAVGLSVNGAPRCVVSLALPNAEEPMVYCTGAILLGEMPLHVNAVLASETGHVEPLHSPLGLLGHLSIDDHTFDLASLPHKMAPDFLTAHDDHEYRLSSQTAATTSYYEEMLVLEGESLSMPCIYDLSPENKTDSSRTQDLDNNWYKLDTPVKTSFSNKTGVHYEISTTGKSVTLNITKYPSAESVEGFYSCWVFYPLPQQSGLNIVTYGVIMVSTMQDKRSWLFWLMTTHVCLVIGLLVLFVLWLVYETYQDYKKGSGYYRCKKLKGDEAYKAMELFIFSDKAIMGLGGIEAAEQAFQRYTEYLTQMTLAEEADNATATDGTTDNQESQYASSEDKDGRLENRRSTNDEKFHSFQDRNVYIPKGMGLTVGVAEVESQSPFAYEEKYLLPRSDSIDKLLMSESEEEMITNSHHSNDNLIDVSGRWKQKETTSKETSTIIGHIQNTTAYQSIKNELKLEPEKLKKLGKYVCKKPNINGK